MIVGGAPKDVIIWDYLRGLGGQVVRRRKRNGVNNYTDMLHFNNMMGTAREDLSTVGFAKVEVNPTEVGSEVQGTPNGYVVTADGEPLAMTQPSDLENHIQFHGGFLEDKNFHTNPDTVGPMGYFYRMGIRHYSPALGRFLQRDPFSYISFPGKRDPISLNPYAYGNNCPTEFSDITGYQACPGCGTPSGGITPTFKMPMSAGHGMGTDPGAPGGNGDIVGPPQDTGEWCAVPFPKECIDDKRFPGFCTVLCCQEKNQSSWLEGCCCGDCASMYPPGTLCNTKDSKECECACCWAGGGENAPIPIGGRGLGGGSTGAMGPYFGPPSIGPWGDGGYPYGPGDYPWIMPAMPNLPFQLFSQKNSSGRFAFLGGILPTYWPDIIWGWVVGGFRWYYGIPGSIALILALLCKGYIQSHYKCEGYGECKEDICKFWRCMCLACRDFLKFIGSAFILAIVASAVALMFAPYSFPLIWNVTNWGALLGVLANSLILFMQCMHG